jgi:hypothetical protein
LLLWMFLLRLYVLQLLTLGVNGTHTGRYTVSLEEAHRHGNGRWL